MIKEDISFEGKLSLQDNLNFHNIYSKYVIRLPIRLLLSFVSITIVTLLFIVGFKKGFDTNLIIFVLVIFYFPFGFYIFNRLEIIFRHKFKPEQYLVNKALFTNEKISVSNEDMDGSMKWNKLEAIISSNKGLVFIIPASKAWFFLPERIFKENTYKDEILNHAIEQNVLVKHVN